MDRTVADPPDDDGRPRSSTVVPHHRPDSPISEQTDIARFTVFYRREVPRLVAFLRWQGASLHDATDCVQETMATAFQRWSNLRQPYAWCRLVASRRYARYVGTLREDLVPDLESAGAVLRVEADLDALEQRHTVLRILSLLPSRQRQVMAWTYDGATAHEIAEALKITPEAVRSNLYKARAALRTYIEETGGELR